MSPKRAREQPEAQAASIADAGDGLADAEALEEVEAVVLQRMRQFEILDKLRTIAKKGRRVMFVGQIEVVLNSIYMHTSLRLFVGFPARDERG